MRGCIGEWMGGRKNLREVVVGLEVVVVGEFGVGRNVLQSKQAHPVDAVDVPEDGGGKDVVVEKMWWWRRCGGDGGGEDVVVEKMWWRW